MIGIGAVAVVAVLALAIVLSGVLSGPGPVSQASASPAPSADAGSSPAATGGPPGTGGPTSSPAVTESDVPSGRIVFARCSASDGTCELVIRNADGSGGGTRITGSPQGAGDPGFSNDGTRVAYRTTAGLRVVTLESGYPWVELTANGSDSNPFWSPDDTLLAFSRVQPSSREIRLLDVAAGTSDRLTDNTVTDHDPVFTPDGRSMIWVEGDGDDRELLRMELASGDIERLTDDAFDDVDPVVSPDGAWLAFVSKRESGDAYELFVMDLSTLEITHLLGVDGDVHDPAWSPGGRYLAVSAGVRGDRDILIYDTVTSNVIELTTNADNDLSPAWR